MNNAAWIYLVLASVMEVCWTYSLKYVSVAKIKAIDWSRFFSEPAGLYALLPGVGYIGFGVLNVILFSMAMRHIPASTAFAIWMGMALIGIKLVDTVVLKEPFELMHIVYIGLVLIGIVGLKRSA